MSTVGNVLIVLMSQCKHSSNSGGMSRGFMTLPQNELGKGEGGGGGGVGVLVPHMH